MKRMKNFGSGLLALMALVVMTASQAQAAGEGWIDNFKEAQKLAKENDKLILADFTGSDWCGWCIKLHEEVFEKQVFKDFVKDNFVLLELDFPRQKKLPAAVEKQNDELAVKYGIISFPTVLVLNPQGEVLAKLSYMDSPEAFIKALKAAQKKA